VTYAFVSGVELQVVCSLLQIMETKKKKTTTFTTTTTKKKKKKKRSPLLHPSIIM
jgi:hypothetical protein